MSRSLRQALFLISIFQFGIFVVNFGFILLMFMQPNSSVSYMPVFSGLILSMYIQAAIVISSIAVISGFIMSFMKPTRGMAGLYKAYAGITVLCGVCWLLASILFARDLHHFIYTNSIPNLLMTSAGHSKSMAMKGLKIGVGMTVGVALQREMLMMMIHVLGEPLNWLIYAAWYPWAPPLLFGMPAMIHALSSVSPILELAKVIEAGGDGTEFVEAKHIQRFYKLSKKEQEKVRENMGFDDSSSDDDSESSDEPAATAKKEKKKLLKKKKSNSSGNQATNNDEEILELPDETPV
jgi:hypothetical protein